MVHFPKLDVAGSSPVSRSIFSITCKHLTQRLAPIGSISHHFENFFELVDRGSAALKRSPRINILVYINGVPHLLGPDLRVHVEFLHEAAVGPAHHLKIYPRKAGGL